MTYWTAHSFSPNPTAEALFPQVQCSTQATQDLVAQLETICDSILYSYLSKVANTAEKRHYLHVSCTAVYELHPRDLEEFNMFLDDLHEFKVFDLHHSVFRPYDLRDLLVPMSTWSHLFDYYWNFIFDPKRSKEFHNENGRPCHGFLATRYMRFLKTLSNSR